MQRWRSPLRSAVALAGAIGARQKQAPPAAGTPKDFVIPSPKRFTLANGLPVTMVPFGQVPKVTIRLVVEAANVHEQKDQVWLADLTGDMMKEGTTTLTADALAREFAAMGGAARRSASGRTGRPFRPTSWPITAPGPCSSSPTSRRGRAFPSRELARVKANMVRDLSIRKSTPQSAAEEKFSELMYGDHPYGRIFPTEAMLNGLHARSGDRPFTAGTSLPTDRVSISPASSTPRPWRRACGRRSTAGRAGRRSRRRRSPRRATGGFALVDRAGAPQSTVMVGLKVPDPSHPDWVALEVTDSLLGGSFASRITANIREQKGYTYSPYSALDSHPGDARWYEAADVTTNVTGPSLKEIFFEIDRLRKDAPAAAELQGIKNNLAGVFVVQNASRGGVLGRLAFVDQHGLGDQYLANYVKRVMAVTPEDVRRIAQSIPDPRQDDARRRRRHQDGAGPGGPLEQAVD